MSNACPFCTKQNTKGGCKPSLDAQGKPIFRIGLISAAAAATCIIGVAAESVCCVCAVSAAAATVTVHKQKNEGDYNKPYNRIVKKVTQTVHFVPPEFFQAVFRSSLISYEKQSYLLLLFETVPGLHSRFISSVDKNSIALPTPVSGKSATPPQPSQYILIYLSITVYL